MTGAPPAATRSSQVGAAAVVVPGFLAVNGERVESTNALVERLGTPGLKGARPTRGAHAACASERGRGNG